MTFQAVRVVIHPSQPGKGISMGVFFPFLEVFKMTEAAFPVPNIVRLFLSKDIAGEQLDRTGYQGRENCLEEQSQKQNDGERRFGHFRHPEARLLFKGLNSYSCG